MRLAVLSDIHGNLEALDRVLEDISSRRIRTCYFLGDAISYGPEPDLCLGRLRENNFYCVLGNHELAIVQPETKKYFNPPTREHFDQSRRLLSDHSLEFISTWPCLRTEHDMLLVHGCPPDSPVRYLFEVQDDELSRIISSMDQFIAFVGHTHELELVQCRGNVMQRRLLSRGVYSLDADRVLVNAGSVGQPRDGDNRAKYIVWDQEKLELEVCFVEYDIHKTVRGILDRGFPDYYAQRLR